MRLVDALAQGRPLLADGAMGTSLFAAGLRVGDPPELWNSLFPDTVASVHAGFVAAGADIILTNSFGGNGCRLAAHGLAEQVRALNMGAARVARAAADRADHAVLVAGCIGPTGVSIGPGGALGDHQALDEDEVLGEDEALSEDEACRLFADQMAALAEGGVDAIWIETLSGASEMRAAARAAVATGLPFTMTASFEATGRTLAGLSPELFADIVLALPTPPAAIGANCGTGPASVLSAVAALRARLPEATLIAKASAGLPESRGNAFRYAATSATSGQYAADALKAGAGIVGGCCGTDARHLAAMRHALDRR